MKKGRFAPSPTGRMHMGNLYAALLSWLSIKSQGGEWLLRIEDIDPQRSKQQWADHIMRDLEWLGLNWDEGPYYQSQRSDIYEQHLRKLQALGLLYPCYCTRSDLLATQAPHESEGRVIYKGTCRPNETNPYTCYSERQAALRLMVPQKEQGMITFQDIHYGSQSMQLDQVCGDFIVRRRDGAWAYQLCVVVDDALMQISEVVRGHDLLLSCPQQQYLAKLLGYSPPRFAHFPLICNATNQRLSKRDKSLDTAALKERYTPEQLLGILATLAGIQPKPIPVTAQELIPQFSWDNVPYKNILLSKSCIE